MLVLTVTVSTVGRARAADEQSPAPTWKVSAEGDVTRLALGSLSIHVMVRPPAAPRLRIGVGRVGGALPALFHRVFDPNGTGWEVTEQGGVASAFFHLNEHGSTFFAGGYVRFDHWTWRRPELAGSASGSQLFVMPAVGYRWFPSSKGTGLFITPWVGLGVSVWNSGPGKLGAHTYEPLRFFPIPAIHVGYEI